MKLVCLGLGYSARAFAVHMAARGSAVSGTSRTASGAAQIAASGWRGLVFDGVAPSEDLRGALQDATHLLVSIPAGPGGDPALLLHADDIAASPRLRWIGYLSTIGVYGDAAGGWVDETTPPEPALARTRHRVTAEQGWLDLGRRAGKPAYVFRLSGIYGPGRNAIESLRAGTARRLVKPGYVSNRIHVDDIATALAATVDGSPGYDLYNVTDDEPAPPQDVVAWAAGLIGVPVPPDIPFDAADLTPMAASFYATCKRVRNDRMKRDLGVRLAYPTYREGLAALVAAN
jgi:nucleoside-diphosphate-sugar epimerase